MSDSNSSVEALLPESRKLLQELQTYAAAESEHISVEPRDQLREGIGVATVGGSFVYYLGNYAEYFANGIFVAEIPIYAAFLAVFSLAAKSLQSICGKRQPLVLIGGMLNGGVSGLSIAAIITGMAFGFIGDLITLGSFTIAGTFVGYLFSHRGRKRHADPCGMWMSCNTWICPKCKHIVVPTDAYRGKDQWDILDVCLYLDVGGLKMNVIQALAFLDFADLLINGRKLSEELPALWNPSEVRKRATDEITVSKFSSLWTQFSQRHELFNPRVDLEKTFLYWERYRESEPSSLGKAKEAIIDVSAN